VREQKNIESIWEQRAKENIQEQDEKVRKYWRIWQNVAQAKTFPCLIN
jgi:hypothetical protein